MALYGWTGDNGDPDNFLDVLLGCTAARIGGNNIASWCNRDYDKLVNDAKLITDRGRARRDLYRAGAGDLPRRGALGAARPFGGVHGDARQRHRLQDGPARPARLRGRGPEGVVGPRPALEPTRRSAPDVRRVVSALRLVHLLVGAPGDVLEALAGQAVAAPMREIDRHGGVELVVEIDQVLNRLASPSRPAARRSLAGAARTRRRRSAQRSAACRPPCSAPRRRGAAAHRPRHGRAGRSTSFRPFRSAMMMVTGKGPLRSSRFSSST